jgi:hypothetical protein
VPIWWNGSANGGRGQRRLLSVASKPRAAPIDPESEAGPVAGCLAAIMSSRPAASISRLASTPGHMRNAGIAAGLSVGVRGFADWRQGQVSGDSTGCDDARMFQVSWTKHGCARFCGLTCNPARLAYAVTRCRKITALAAKRFQVSWTEFTHPGTSPRNLEPSPRNLAHSHFHVGERGFVNWRQGSVSGESASCHDTACSRFRELGRNVRGFVN